MSSAYIKDDRYHEAIEKLKFYIEKFSNEKNLEIEFRLGYMENNKFKTNIGKIFFEKILKTLNSTSVWSQVKKENTIDYFNSKKRITSKNGEETCLKKEKLAVVDFELIGSGFDVRVSFSRETPVSPFNKSEYDYVRKKNRNSYFYTNFSYDLTDVITEDNSVEDHTYEFELEIVKLDLKKMSSVYIVHDSLLKITDVVKMCEEDLNEDYEYKFSNEKIY